MANCIPDISQQPPLVAPSVTDRQKCLEFRTWEAESLYPWLLQAFPKICDALGWSNKLLDLSNFRGSWNAGTYAKGDLVVKDGFLFISLVDSNSTIPPSNDWYQYTDDWLLKTGGTITGDLEVSGNLTKSGDPVATIGSYKNSLFSESTTPSNIDPSSVAKANPDHVHILSNHTNTPDTAHFWHIDTQWYSASENCRQIAVQYNGGTDMYVRSRYNNAWTPWMKIAMMETETGWIDLTLINDWTGYCQYKKYKDGTVAIRAAIRNASGSSGYDNRQVCTLPVGLRPNAATWCETDTTRNGYFVPTKIGTDGKVYTRTVGDYYYYFKCEFKRY